MLPKSGLGGKLIQILLYGIGLGSICAMVYLAGPYIEIHGWRPLESEVVRSLVIAILTAIVAGIVGYHIWRKNKQSEALAKGIAGAGEQENDSEVLAERMQDALLKLKKTSGSTADSLYNLPWYIIIGPPGSGKTTALVNSGLRFPLCEGSSPTAIAGTGGTRYCDWWFTEDAVLIDTAGRYTTQDSDAKTDRESWFSFLNLLKKNRPKQPINGVMVAISVEDILKLDSESLAAHSKAIRTRLVELHDLLKIDFPVYVIFTKADLIAGFQEYFFNLDERDRRQVWGSTFQTTEKTKNSVAQAPEEFDALVERLNLSMPDRLQQEPAPLGRVALFGFPAQMSALRRPLCEFLNAIFEPTRYHARANLRGFYFTSGTQQGTPIDQLINALVKNFGAQDVGANAYSGVGKSYFIHDLIQKLIIGEAAWVSTDPRAVRRALFLKATGLTAIIVVTLCLFAAFTTSFRRNEALTTSAGDAAKDYTNDKIASQLAQEPLVADRDFNKVLPLLQRLRYSPSGYAYREVATPFAESFGLGQRDRLQSVSESAYRLGLERLMRPRLLFRLEELLDEKRSDPSFIYEALKVYMMLGAQAPVDKELVLSWERQDWADRLFPGSAFAAGRQQLEDHLVALLDLANGREPMVDVSATVIQESQQLLARLSLKERAYELMKSDARAAMLKTKDFRDWSAPVAGGVDFATVFEAPSGQSLDTLTVPGFFTYAGFQRAFINKLPGIADRMAKERWVLGSLAEQGAVAEQYKTLTKDLLDLYTRDFINAWMTTLKKIQLKRMTADKPRYIALTAAAGANSPLKSLFESIRDETALTKERADFKKDAAQSAQVGGSQLLGDLDQIPGAKIEEAFRPYHRWVEMNGSRRQIDELIALLSDVRDNLINSTLPAQAAQSNMILQGQIQRYRASANQLPDPVKDTMLRAGSDFEGDVNNSELGLLRRAFSEQVAGACQQVTNGRYPFTRSASSEIALADFGRLFKPNGIFDQFFQGSLKKYVDTSNPKSWNWRADQPVTKSLSAETLKQFQRADDIKNVFFASGGVLPSIDMNVFPPMLGGSGITVKLELNGQFVSTQSGQGNAPPAPQALRWPGAAAGGRAAVTLASDSFGGQPGSTLEKSGAWSFFRLLDAASPVMRGDRLVASFLLGGREIQYQFATGTTQNPFTLPALREFHCPTGL